MRVMNPSDAWLAGLFEGEGTILAHPGTGEAWWLRLAIEMTDEDVVKRAASVAGCGSVNGPYSRKTRNFVGKTTFKPTYCWSVTRGQDVVDLVERLLPYLGDRRTRQVRQAVTQWELTRSTPERRFWKKVDRTGDCWRWRGSLDQGVGRFEHAGRRTAAHRYAAELLGVGLQRGSRQLCVGNYCVNPDHWKAL